MLVTQSGSPLLISGQKILTSGRFVDTFNRGASLTAMPLGMGWQDLGELFPTQYDISRIHSGSYVTTGDPYWRGKNGALMAPDDDWANYINYSGMSFGGVGGAIRNVGDGMYNYDVTCRISGIVGGHTSAKLPEAEGTPIVGVNIASPKLGYGCWLVNLKEEADDPDFFALLVGYVGNPPEAFSITHVGGLTHTLGQEREITLKYRGTGFTVWFEGVQVTSLFTWVNNAPVTPIGSAQIPVHADHQNRSWAGFEFDTHITQPAEMTSVPAILSYSHQAIV